MIESGGLGANAGTGGDRAIAVRKEAVDGGKTIVAKPVIICIDDEPVVIESLKIELRKALGDECLIETALGGEEALELFRELQAEDDYEVALVVSDYIMPDIKGDELLKRIHSISPQTLKIMLTGQADLEAVGRAIRNARLYRYIAKPWEPEDLRLTAIEALHSYLRDRKLEEQNQRIHNLNDELEELARQQAKIIEERTAALESANRELQRLAITDSLTQIPNRRYFNERLGQEWELLAADAKPLSLILFDVDYFKRYNDAYGHLEGDRCLYRVAQAAAGVVRRASDLVARYGGEEFVAILPGTPASGAIAIAEKIRLAVLSLEIPHAKSDISDYVTVSVGVASQIPTPEQTPQVPLSAADEALYTAKRQGRNRAIASHNES